MIKYKSKNKDQTTQYPYQNLSLTDLEGEQWKEINGYDGLYSVSNFGRIKSMPRVIEFVSNGREISFMKQARILKQRVLRNYSIIKNSYTDTLTVYILHSNFVVARLVYQAFISEIDFEVDKLIISHRNDDPLDNFKDNLLASSLGNRFKYLYKKGEMPHSEKLNDHISTDTRHWATQGKFRQVSQYNMDGHFVRTYDCLSDAARAVGGHAVNIRFALTGRKVSAAGFLWRDGEGRPKINIKEINKRLLAHKSQNCKSVTRYDLSGKRIEIYTSVAEAARSVYGSKAAIRRAMIGKSKTSYGNIWRVGKGPAKIQIS